MTPPSTYPVDTIVYWHDPDNQRFSGYYRLAQELKPGKQPETLTLKSAANQATAIFKPFAKNVELDPPKDNHVVDIVLPALSEDSSRTVRRSFCVPSLLVKLFGCNTEEETYNCMLANRHRYGTTITRHRIPTYPDDS